MKKIIIVLALLICAGCFNGEYEEYQKYPFVEGRNMSVIFFNVGQGDSELIIAPDGSLVLVDCGEFEDASLYLLEMNITWIDVLVITHDDKDHSGGCSYVMESVDVGVVLTNENVYSDFELNITNTTFIEVITAYDTNGRFEGDNDNSLILKVGYGNISVLFMGDCEWRCENELLKTHKKEIDADLLKVGHHGAKFSSTAEFLKKVSASAAVISLGKGNKYGHPDNETLERLNSFSVDVYRTDSNGTIMLTTDGNRYEFS